MMFWLAIQPNKRLLQTQMGGKFPRDAEQWPENMLQTEIEAYPNRISHKQLVGFK